jgi:Raf kinase inhibitor-like YbhB/YbcL family protein
MKKRIVFIIIAVTVCAGFQQARGEARMEIKSPEFKDGQFIPGEFSCEGTDINPELIIEGIPPEAKSLALIVDDPDAPSGTWVHWVVFDIPPTGKIKENSVPGTQGKNSSGQMRYHGPCPPFGTHRYFFKLYALDTRLDLKEGINKEQLEIAMTGHILADTQLVGLFKSS